MKTQNLRTAIITRLGVPDLRVTRLLQQVDRWNINIMQKYSVVLLQYSIALIFFWFGILKPFGLSPAQELVERTVFWFSPDWFVPFLGWWEVTIGLCFLFKSTIRFALILLFMQIPGTFLPLFLLPEETFTHFPYGLTLEGQYIIKNFILIAGAIAIGGSLTASAAEENEN